MLTLVWTGGIKVSVVGNGLGNLKPFNCLLLVLSLSFSLTCCINTLVRSVLLWSNKCNNNNNAEITPFIPVLAGGNLHMSQTLPTRDETCNLQMALSRMLMLPFFSILPVLHMQDILTLVLNFEEGHFVRHLLLLSFFFLVLLWEEFNPHSFVVTFHFSHLSGSPPVYYPAKDSCWIHVNVSCSACINITPLIVSLNDEPQLAHQRQNSTNTLGKGMNSTILPSSKDK